MQTAMARGDILGVKTEGKVLAKAPDFQGNPPKLPSTLKLPLPVSTAKKDSLEAKARNPS